MKIFVALALFVLVAGTSAAPAPKDAADSQTPKVPSNNMLKLAKAVQDAQDEAQSSDNDDVVAVLNDIVNVLNTINGMNSVGLDSVDVVNTGTGFGEIEVVAGNTGETVKVQVGDLTNVIGSIQGTWFNNDVVDNDIGIDSDNEGVEDDDDEEEADENEEDEEDDEPQPIDAGNVVIPKKKIPASA